MNGIQGATHLYDSSVPLKLESKNQSTKCTLNFKYTSVSNKETNIYNNGMVFNILKSIP